MGTGPSKRIDQGADGAFVQFFNALGELVGPVREGAIYMEA